MTTTGTKIPAPTPEASDMTEQEIARWYDHTRILDTDPRTAGSMPRPRWLVERVLAERRSA